MSHEKGADNPSSEKVPIPPPLPHIRISIPAQFEQRCNVDNWSQTPAEIAASVICKTLSRYGETDISSTALFCAYCHTQPIIQSGPTCGLAAAAIAAQVVNEGTELPSILDLHEAALKRCYTISGEMFSAENLSTLCKDYMNCFAEVSKEGMEDKIEILNHLIQGGVLLIPYDCDRNFSPAVLKGHQAHWSIVTGFLLIFQIDSEVAKNLMEFSKQDAVIQTLNHVQQTMCLKEKDISSCQQVYLFCRQTKSKHVALWPYEDLQQSNYNLVEIGPKIEKEIQKYVIPEGGVSEGLRGKIIFLKKIK